MLKMTSVKKNYRDFTLDCTLEIKPGYVTGLVGRNGAGKTTAFKSVLGLISVDGGEIEIFGKKLSDFKSKDRRFAFGQRFFRRIKGKGYNTCFVRCLFTV